MALTDAKDAIYVKKDRKLQTEKIWCCILLHDMFVVHFEVDTQGDKQDTLQWVLRTPAAHCGHKISSATLMQRHKT